MDFPSGKTSRRDRVYSLRFRAAELAALQRRAAAGKQTLADLVRRAMGLPVSSAASQRGKR